VKRPLSETADIEAEVAGASLIIIDGHRTSAELKATIDEFVQDCEAMSRDGRTVIAMAVAVDKVMRPVPTAPQRVGSKR
jgi:pyrimidine operon attenuation protein/uracil phosphoribosyltransferase